MNILGDKKMSFEQVIDTCVGVPKREDVVKNDTAQRSFWKPVSHSNFVNALATGIEHHGLEISDSSFALNKTGHMLVGGFKLKGDMLPAMPSGVDAEWEMLLKHANNMTAGMQLYTGMELMICTNGCTSGEMLARHKHTTHFDVDEWARDVALTAFLDDCVNQTKNVQKLRCSEMSDRIAAECILETGRRGILPKAQAVDVWSEWVEPVFDDIAFPRNTAWKLYGDMTHVAQKCSPQRQLQIVQMAGPVVHEFVDKMAVAATPAEMELF